MTESYPFGFPLSNSYNEDKNLISKSNLKYKLLIYCSEKMHTIDLLMSTIAQKENSALTKSIKDKICIIQ